MEFLVKKIQNDISYLKSQGKQIKEIRMNSKLLENMLELMNIQMLEESASISGVKIEADDRYEHYVFVLEEAT